MRTIQKSVKDGGKKWRLTQFWYNLLSVVHHHYIHLWTNVCLTIGCSKHQPIPTARRQITRRLLGLLQPLVCFHTSSRRHYILSSLVILECTLNCPISVWKINVGTSCTICFCAFWTQYILDLFTFHIVGKLL